MLSFAAYSRTYVAVSPCCRRKSSAAQAPEGHQAEERGAAFAGGGARQRAIGGRVYFKAQSGGSEVPHLRPCQASQRRQQSLACIQGRPWTSAQRRHLPGSHPSHATARRGKSGLRFLFDPLHPHSSRMHAKTPGYLRATLCTTLLQTHGS